MFRKTPQRVANMMQGIMRMLTLPSDYSIAYEFCYMHDPEADCHYVVITRCCCPCDRRGHDPLDQLAEFSPWPWGHNTNREACVDLDEAASLIDQREEQSIRAQARWAKVRGYLILTRVFRETHHEENREAHFYELIGYLQIPGFNWRRPTAAQMHQLRRFEKGLDDPRLCNMELYVRTRWLAREMLGTRTKTLRTQNPCCAWCWLNGDDEPTLVE